MCSIETHFLSYKPKMHPSQASTKRTHGACSSGEAGATRTSVREPKAEPKMQHQGFLQHRIISPPERAAKPN